MTPTKIHSIVSLIFIISLSSIVDLSESYPTIIDFPGADVSGDGSKCPGTVCVRAPSGTECQARYLERDHCCPTWICANGQTAYGRVSAGGVAWKSGDGTSSGYSYSSGVAASEGIRNGGDGQSPTGFSQTITSDDGNAQMSSSSYSSSSSSGFQSSYGQGQSMGYGFAAAPGELQLGVLPRINNNRFLSQQAAAVAMFGGGAMFGR